MTTEEKTKLLEDYVTLLETVVLEMYEDLPNESIIKQVLPCILKSELNYFSPLATE